MAIKLAFNHTDGAVLTDELGHTIGGHGWGPLDTTDPVGSAAIEAGYLSVVDEDALAGSDNPDVIEALAALEERRSRVAEAQARSKDELLEALPDDVVADLPEGGDGKPAKADLVDAAVAAPEEPTPSKPRSGRKK